MKIIDFHNTLVNNAINEFNRELKKHDILILITGYGSNNNSCKVRNALIREIKKLNVIMFVGSELNLSNESYNKLPINIKNKLSKYILDPAIIGMIFVIKL